MDNEISLLNLAFLLKLTAVIGVLAAISCVLALVMGGVGPKMNSQTVFVLTIIWLCGALLADFGLLLAHCFGWASPSWGWYPLIALIGIVPIFGLLFCVFYVLADIMR